MENKTATIFKAGDHVRTVPHTRSHTRWIGTTESRYTVDHEGGKRAVVTAVFDDDSIEIRYANASGRDLVAPEWIEPDPELWPNKPGTAPNTSLWLDEAQRAWLQDQGGIQPTIRRLINDAMER